MYNHLLAISSWWPIAESAATLTKTVIVVIPGRKLLFFPLFVPAKSGEKPLLTDVSACYGRPNAAPGAYSRIYPQGKSAPALTLLVRPPLDGSDVE